MLTQTLSLVEALWTGCSVVGSLIALINLLDALNDYGSLRRSGKNGPRSLVARGNVNRELSRAVALIGCVVAGISASLLPGDSAAPRTHLDALSIIAFFAVLIALAGNSIADRFERRRLLAMLDDLAEKRMAVATVHLPGEELVTGHAAD